MIKKDKQKSDQKHYNKGVKVNIFILDEDPGVHNMKGVE